MIVILAKLSLVGNLFVIAYLIYRKLSKRSKEKAQVKSNRDHSLNISILRSLVTDWNCYKATYRLENGEQVSDYIMPMGKETMIISGKLVCVNYTLSIFDTIASSVAYINPISKEEFSQAYHETCTDMASFIVKSRQK